MEGEEWGVCLGPDTFIDLNFEVMVNIRNNEEFPLQDLIVKQQN